MYFFIHSYAALAAGRTLFIVCLDNMRELLRSRGVL